MCLEAYLSPLGLGVGGWGQRSARLRLLPRIFSLVRPSAFPCGVREGSNLHFCSGTERLLQQRDAPHPTQSTSLLCLLSTAFTNNVTQLSHQDRRAHHYAMDSRRHRDLHNRVGHGFMSHASTTTSAISDQPRQTCPPRRPSHDLPVRAGQRSQAPRCTSPEGSSVMHTTPAPRGRQSRSARPRLLLIRLVYCASAAVGS